MAQAEAGGATYAGPPFVIYPEECVGEFPMVLCMPVAPGGAAPDPASGVELKEVAGGKAASVMHMGPYERLGDAYGVMQTWLTGQRQDAGRPAARDLPERPRFGRAAGAAHGDRLSHRVSDRAGPPCGGPPRIT